MHFFCKKRIRDPKRTGRATDKNKVEEKSTRPSASVVGDEEEIVFSRGNHAWNHISILSSPDHLLGRTSKCTNVNGPEQEHCDGSCSACYSLDDNNTISSEGSTRSLVLTALVGLVGLLAAATFVGFGITSETSKQQQSFHQLSEEFALQIHAAWVDYETASRWLHQACAFKNFTRDEFRHIYEYMTVSLEVQNINWLPMVLHEERAALEEETRSYFAEHYPNFEYGGIQELYRDPAGSDLDYFLIPRAEADVYYPAHYVEPMMENSLLLDYDVGSLKYSRIFIEQALSTWEPIISLPFRLFPGTTMVSEHNALMLLHPGIPLENHTEVVPKDIAMIVVNMDMIAKRMLSGFNYKSVAIYLYDSRDEAFGDVFLIGVDSSKEPSTNGFYLPEIGLQELNASTTNLMDVKHLSIATAKWTMVVVALDGEFTNNNTSIIIAGIFIFVACAFVAFWIWWDTQRNRKIQLIRRKADIENAAIKLQSARDNAKAEQELNDYIAHEIRNPLAAAMSACSFVKASVHKKYSLRDEDSQQSVREDVDIIESSLTFINDLLRSMLDMHKAASKRIDVTLAPADMLKDILQPVAAMLYKRDSNFEVFVECPENLIVSTDKLRMKQIILNLGRNSTKFVDKGFIKLVAGIVNEKVQLSIEDSGPGIPEEKRNNLFNKFQESLDVLEQGTGMGLCLCKNLTQLLGGDIWLDESYDSGVPGRAGTRFIVATNLTPMSVDECHEYLLHREVDQCKEWMERSLQDIGGVELSILPEKENEEMELPVSLSVLFVDDDMVLRKLFSRSLRTVASAWTIKEAANGETALQMALEQEFDLIFLDQYMASAEKTMLGTETVRAMRAQGVTSRVCGLSANDMRQSFLNAGADNFLQKPFPCKPEDLRKVLNEILASTVVSNFQKVMEESSSSSTTTVPMGDSDSSALPESHSGLPRA